tara:strand:+ start:2035 stop:2544 length:510 start_codon:yes stop_codon:yes gene_type:complete
MNKNDAELLIEKENLRKEKIKSRMHNYRNNNDFRKKNADYMKEYREKQKKLLEEAKKIVKNDENIEKYVSNTVLKKIKIIQRNHSNFSKNSLDKTILINIFNDNIDKSYEKYIFDNMNYLKNINDFLSTLRRKYTNIKTLKGNILPFLNILKKINIQNYNTLNLLYKSL